MRKEGISFVSLINGLEKTTFYQKNVNLMVNLVLLKILKQS